VIQHNEPLTAGHIVKAYALLAVLPYSKATDPQLIAALLSAYRAAEVSGTELLEAAAWAAQTQTAWPAPAALIGRVRDARERAQAGGAIQTAEEAWGQVIRTMQNSWSGQGLPPSLSPRAQCAFAAAFGPSWSAFWGTALSSDMVSHRSRFIDAYRSSSALDKQLLAHELRKREDANAALGGMWRPRIPYSQLPSEEQDPEDVANYTPETCPDDNPYDPADTEGYAQ
jgi:hypothetical protein